MAEGWTTMLKTALAAFSANSAHALICHSQCSHSHLFPLQGLLHRPCLWWRSEQHHSQLSLSSFHPQQPKLLQFQPLLPKTRSENNSLVRLGRIVACLGSWLLQAGALPMKKHFAGSRMSSLTVLCWLTLTPSSKTRGKVISTACWGWCLPLPIVLLRLLAICTIQSDVWLCPKTFSVRHI